MQVRPDSSDEQKIACGGASNRPRGAKGKLLEVMHVPHLVKSASERSSFLVLLSTGWFFQIALDPLIMDGSANCFLTCKSCN